jgi:N-acetyl sugar amidotransferase
MSESRIRCEVCVMDTSDPGIQFFGKDGCNHCISMRKSMGVTWHLHSTNQEKLSELLERIKRSGRVKKYDCILGLSGGVDSSYLALKAYDWGLRPLVIHVDAGWNSEVAVRNIQAILDYTGWDLHTEVIDWNEIRSLQLAFLRSGVANQDTPQDHAFFTVLNRKASEHKIKYILHGGNESTEGIFPSKWQNPAMDSKLLNDVNKKFGNSKLKKYPTSSFFSFYFYYPYIRRIRSVRLLNLDMYNKYSALKELQERINYQSYSRKHGESVFTRFFQNFYFVQRYGIDKRIAHMSSMIISKQITRDEALLSLEEPLYNELELNRDLLFVCDKLQINSTELMYLIYEPKINLTEFKNWSKSYQGMKKIQKLVESLTGKKIGLSH